MPKSIWFSSCLCVLFMCITASYKSTVLGNASKPRVGRDINASEIFWPGRRSKTSTIIRVSKVNPFFRNGIFPPTSISGISNSVASSSSVNHAIEQELLDKIKTANVPSVEVPFTSEPFNAPSISIPTTIPGRGEKIENSVINAILQDAKDVELPVITVGTTANLVPTPVASTFQVDSSQGTKMDTQPLEKENSTIESPQMESEKVPTLTEVTTEASNASLNDKILKKLGTADVESEAMPSFDEWKKKMLAEHQQTEGEKPVQMPSIPGKKPGTPLSKRNRNYASSECGAKILASNPEAEAPYRILNEQMDMYMLNPCKAKIWFVIELCETIQATQFELANFELFSSLPRDFSLYWSDRFPTREWTPLGSFLAPDQRALHNFDLKHHGYGKFLKVELHSYYGHEHYCPLSLVRVFGTSMVDEYEEMETGGLHLQSHISDTEDVPAFQEKEDDSTKNLFGSARDAVLNIVRKAARALGREDLDVKTDASTESSLESGTEMGIDNDSIPVTTHSLWKYSARLGLLLDECGLCVESQEASPCYHSRKCLFFLSIFNISTIAQFCQTTACSLVTSYANETVPSTPELQTVPKNIFEPTELSKEDLLKEKTEENNATDPVIYLPPISKDTIQSGNDNNDIVSTAVKVANVPSLPAKEVPVLQSSLSEFSAQEGSTSTLSASFTSTTTQPDLLTTISPELEEIPDNFILDDDVAKEPRKDLHDIVPVRNLGVLIPTGQKESVFMRLSNRIKVLEMNMSLSSLYLQELSQRYRKQMEDMQRGFNRTVAALNDTAQLAEHRDKQQQEAIRKLQVVVIDLKMSVDQLMSERESFFRQVLEAHLFLLAVETIVVITIMTLCMRRMRYTSGHREDLFLNSDVENSLEVEKTNCSSPLKRHNSTNDLMRSLVPGKKRRPSDVVSYTGTYSELLIVEPAMPIFIEPGNKIKKKNRHRKSHRGIARSVSIPNLNQDKSDRCQTCLAKKRDNGGAVSSIAGDLLGTRQMTKNCENCCFFIPSLPAIVSPAKQAKIPLQNLTNGSPDEASQNGAKAQLTVTTTEAPAPCKEHFSFRKLLKFRKNEAV